MLHPSYTDLMKEVNKGVEEGEEKVVNSRYSIVLATSKRARQLIDGAPAKVSGGKCPKPLSVAIDELNHSKIRILTEEEELEEDTELPAGEEILEGAELSDGEELLEGVELQKVSEEETEFTVEEETEGVQDEVTENVEESVVQDMTE